MSISVLMRFLFPMEPKSDSGNIQEIFGLDNKVAVCDPVYPVYVDTNVMAGRTGDYNTDRVRILTV